MSWLREASGALVQVGFIAGTLCCLILADERLRKRGASAAVRVLAFVGIVCAALLLALAL